MSQLDVFYVCVILFHYMKLFRLSIDFDLFSIFLNFSSVLFCFKLYGFAQVFLWPLLQRHILQIIQRMHDRCSILLNPAFIIHVDE